VKELQALGLSVIPTGVVLSSRKTSLSLPENEEEIEHEAKELASASGEEIISEVSVNNAPVSIPEDENVKGEE